jgi:hypothetical protein
MFMAEPVHVSTIEVSVDDIEQLYESLDPYPFHERDLDRDAEAYIVGWARELPRDHALRIVVHVTAAALQAPGAVGLARSMSRFFSLRTEETARDLRELFRIGRMSLLIGILVLGTCVAGTQYVGSLLGEGPLADVTRESLIIMGWVANWRPLEIFLYEWWPVARRRNLYRRLSAAKVELLPVIRATSQGLA